MSSWLRPILAKIKNKKYTIKILIKNGKMENLTILGVKRSFRLSKNRFVFKNSLFSNSNITHLTQN